MTISWVTKCAKFSIFFMPRILAGGLDGPLVAFSVQMSKRMIILGQILCALVDVTLRRPNLFVMTGNAGLLTNMYMDKCVDGIAG